VTVRTIEFAEIAAAYIPLHKATHFGIDSDNGAAVAVAPGIAATVGHNANLVDPKAIIGRSRDYDLLFFHTGQPGPDELWVARPGAPVTAYGQGGDGDLRMAHGVVRALEACDGCTAPAYFTFAGDAGPGFSGGPVVDAKGRLIGIVFGYKDAGRERLVYAYDMARIFVEMNAIVRGPRKDAK
jgi:hypothetical protein